MAAKTRKPAPARSRTSQSRATQAKAGAGPAVAERSKDAKPSFGKAAPKKVVPGATHKVAAKPAKPHKPAASKAGPIRAVASAATGAVVATARLAASVLGRGGAKAKTK
ncbi:MULTISPECIES: hypothetical protein [unclassified Mesorhizobium]|uniref:hypothetical protein n=1 Tax=unclassified Mesorhizobium TaxID=325217 RepID=UPI000BAFCBD9|nr:MULTISPECIES: hypothetical protein [unclassified Mesorhizobium]TGT60635.1 hypothetical protein EN813_023405 [Mesorhizobium sp. M00.F.Ca.ET.170.01.1.1]AZO10266.1 hypothetical protein EJ074_14915 [Mesorhizobium sp. M3A.F.Ca.ET.080.04.2.1]PBB87797.1 hypothetical protein CK216_04455 [Mesorhizobium sp. WSM3876]RWB73738.1 MAG: hypothetical protein EOQ49_09425 [Mesorhizobium sp.]RWB91706.1 MAG: hypothetical protein EOQ52_04980 [Mesorhizobium sp.]